MSKVIANRKLFTSSNKKIEQHTQKYICGNDTASATTEGSPLDIQTHKIEVRLNKNNKQRIIKENFLERMH